MINDTFTLYDLRVNVVGNPKEFVCAHKPGHAFDVVGENIIFASGDSFSQYALATLLPLLPAKQRPTHPNDWMTTDTLIVCPDPHCKAQFEIVRKQQTTFKHSETTRVPLQNGDNDELH